MDPSLKKDRAAFYLTIKMLRLSMAQCSFMIFIDSLKRSYMAKRLTLSTEMDILRSGLRVFKR